MTSSIQRYISCNNTISIAVGSYDNKIIYDKLWISVDSSNFQ